MKNIIVTLVSILLTVNCFAQSGESLYKKYSTLKGVDAVYISPSMFQMFGLLPVDDMDDMNMESMVKSFTSFYMIEIDDDVKNASALVADVNKMISTKKYELLMESKDDDEKAMFYVKMDGEYITSLVMLEQEISDDYFEFNYDNDVTFFILEGKIHRSNLSKIVNGIDD